MPSEKRLKFHWHVAKLYGEQKRKAERLGQPTKFAWQCTEVHKPLKPSKRRSPTTWAGKRARAPKQEKR